MEVWLIEFIRWPGYDAYEDVLGVYSSLVEAKKAIPYEMEWERTKPHRVYEANDPNGDQWFIRAVIVDAPIVADYPTWDVPHE